MEAVLWAHKIKNIPFQILGKIGNLEKVYIGTTAPISIHISHAMAYNGRVIENCKLDYLVCSASARGLGQAHLPSAISEADKAPGLNSEPSKELAHQRL